MVNRQRRWRGPGWPWQAYERRGDAGYNVIFKGDIPNMTVGLILLGLVYTGGLYLISLFDRTEEDHSAYFDAVAACDAWEELRDGLDDDHLSQDERVELARGMESRARGSDVDFWLFNGIADRVERGRELGAYPERADRECDQLSQSHP